MAGTEPTLAAPYPKPAIAWYVVGILLLAGITSYLDRNLFALLLIPVREHLQISDTEVSLLYGMAFTLFYVIAGFPFGMLVDRVNRRNVIIFGVLVWSCFTAACGFADTYWEMFIARMGIGVGEACLGPAAYSIIADSGYNLSNYIGGGSSSMLGGLILTLLPAGGMMLLPFVGEAPAWKAAFFIAAAPGFFVALLLLTVKDPPRRDVAKPVRDGGRGPSILAYLGQHWPVYSSLYVVFIATAFVGLTFNAWGPTYFVRQFGLTLPQAGLYTGSIAMIFGVSGALCSGVVGDALTARGRSRFTIPIVAWPFMLCGLFLVCLAPTLHLALAGEALVVFGSGLGLVAGPPNFHDVTPNQFRGRVQAVYFMLTGILGIGIGPWLVARVTDGVFHDDQAIRYSLLIVLAPVAVVAFIVCLASQGSYRTLRREFVEVTSASNASG
jgi:MFS family permease